MSRIWPRIISCCSAGYLGRRVRIDTALFLTVDVALQLSPSLFTFLTPFPSF